MNKTNLIFKFAQLNFVLFFNNIKYLSLYTKLLQSCPNLCDPMDHSPPVSSVRGILQAWKLGCHALFQGIFPTQELNPHLLCLLHWQVGSLPLVQLGPISFSNFKKIIYFWLYWVSIAVWGLSLVAASGVYLCLQCSDFSFGGFSCCGTRALWLPVSVVVAHGLSCSAACGIFPDRGSNPCPLHWQGDS